MLDFSIFLFLSALLTKPTLEVEFCTFFSFPTLDPLSPPPTIEFYLFFLQDLLLKFSDLLDKISISHLESRATRHIILAGFHDARHTRSATRLSLHASCIRAGERPFHLHISAKYIH